MARQATPAVDTADWPRAETAAAPSGLRCACLERPGTVVALRLTAAVGARDDVVAGATHMLEHLLFRTGSGARARQRIERLGGEVGASTTREQVAVDVVVLPGDVEHGVAALRTILAARPGPTDLESEKSVVLAEVAHEEEERRRIWQLQAEALFGVDHPLARPILGSTESIPTLTMSELARSQSRLTTGNCALAAVGPVSPKRLLSLVDDLLPDGAGTDPLRLPADPLRPARRRHEERRSKLLHLAVGWRFDGLADPSLPALRLAEIILAHGSGSRLYEQLRTRRRLAYRVSTVLVPYRDAGHLSAVTACDPHHAEQAETALVAELERLAAHGPTWAELDAAKRQHTGGRARAFESSRRLAGYTATQLLWNRLEPIEREQATLRELSTRDVRDACSALLRAGRRGVASVGRTPAPS